MTEAIEVNGPIQSYYDTLSYGYKFKSTGMPFNGKIPKLINDQRIRIVKKKASCIIIDGGVGEGKTTLGIEVLEEYQQEKIDYKSQYAIGGEEFTKKIKLCIAQNKKAIIYDEAGDFNKRGFATAFNKLINRIFEIYRTFRILVIIILPNFNLLDNNLFDNRIPRLLFHCHNRNEKYGKVKIYGLWRMLWLRDWMKKLPVKSDAYKITRPNSQAYFKNFPLNREVKLDKLTSAGKFEELRAADIKNNKMITYEQLSSSVERSVTWIKQKVSELGIKEAEIYKKKKYFSKSTADVLRDYILKDKETKQDQKVQDNQNIQ